MTCHYFQSRLGAAGATLQKESTSTLKPWRVHVYDRAIRNQHKSHANFAAYQHSGPFLKQEALERQRVAEAAEAAERQRKTREAEEKRWGARMRVWIWAVDNGLGWYGEKG